jgi:endonuclease G
MQNAQTLYLKTVEGLVQENEVEKAIQLLLVLDDEAQAGIRQDVILMSAQLKELEKNVQRGLVSPMDPEYQKVKNRIRYGLTEMMKDIPRKIELYAQIKNLNTYQFDISDKAVKLEKIIGSTENLVTIAWLEKALHASRAVCRIIRDDTEMGTGFLSSDGYLFTNHHVLDSRERAEGAIIEFNYEVGSSGNIKQATQYKLDASDFITSDVPNLDFTRVKVVDQNDKPLRDWGSLDFSLDAPPAVGSPVAIIQHPGGKDKRIALRANEVVGQNAQYLHYTTDTEPGSSGSPVFNKDWKVVALHHSFNRNANANEGILFRDIFAFIEKQKSA